MEIFQDYCKHCRHSISSTAQSSTGGHSVSDCQIQRVLSRPMVAGTSSLPLLSLRQWFIFLLHPFLPPSLYYLWWSHYSSGWLKTHGNPSASTSWVLRSQLYVSCYVQLRQCFLVHLRSWWAAGRPSGNGYFVSIRSAESYLLYTATLWTQTLGTRTLHCSGEFHVIFSQRPLLLLLLLFFKYNGQLGDLLLSYHLGWHT